ncbi:MAG: class I SAM-dependent methyltransferase [Deltaproteobacteria bacterium]|nr:class I SAM-dependent methyltransferase [Deltaproteobacteria bacterium]
MAGYTDHWQGVYTRKAPDQVSWYRAHLDQSLAAIDALRLPPLAGIIDVGGGAATLVDDLVARGFTNVTVLDIAEASLNTAKQRLGARAALVHWLAQDITRAELPAQAYDFWHDRAVFHFLTDPQDRARYVAAVRRSVRPGGHVLVATFGPEGPQQCSGLDVCRYDADRLHDQFGPDFERIDALTEVHATPWGSQQQFVYCLCRVSA